MKVKNLPDDNDSKSLEKLTQEINNIIEKLEIIDINVNDLISNIYPGDTVIGFSIILICAFGVKLVFVLLSNYFELKLLKIIRLDFSKKLFPEGPTK